MSNYNPGSAGAAEEKQNRILLIVFAIITLLVLGLEFVFPTDIKTSVMDAAVLARIAGGLLTAASWLPLYLGVRQDDETKGYKIAWVVMLVLGLLVAIQFGDTPNDYKMH